MTVFSLCNPNVATVSPQATLQQAALLMQVKSVGCLVVTDIYNVPLGVITDRDIVVRSLIKGMAPDCETVENIMSKNPIQIERNADISEAVDILNKSRARRLLIVNKETNSLCGILSADDLLLKLAKQIADLGSVYNLQASAGKTTFESDFTQMA